MADGLPYFKFEVSKWISGKITLEKMDVQGLFINISALYWQRSGNLTLTETKRRLLNVKPKAFDSLIESGLIKLNGDNLSIDYLDEQLNERKEKHEINRANGLLGGRPKKPKAFDSLTEPKGIRREEKRREKKRREKIREGAISFDLFWDKYGKRVGKKNCESKWYKLSNETHGEILKHLDKYIEATPDVQYRKNPETYLNQESWNDEVVPPKSNLPRFI